MVGVLGGGEADEDGRELGCSRVGTQGLASPDPDVRRYLAAKLMRQAKPDDVFQFLDLRDIVAWWPGIQRYLGKSRGFWTWLLQRWESQGVVRR